MSLSISEFMATPFTKIDEDFFISQAQKKRRSRGESLMPSDIDELNHAAAWALAAPAFTASVFWVYNRFREEGGLSKRVIGLI